MWLTPHLFGLEVKQGKAHATTRQLSRLVWLRKHRVSAWIVRSPQEALMIIDKTLEGVDMAFNDDLLAELDAALMGGPAPTPELDATVQPEAELPVFDADDDQTHDEIEALTNGTAMLPTVADMSRVTEAMGEETDAMERQANALEAIALELSRLNGNLAVLVENLGWRHEPPQPEPVQTAAAPTPRRRRAAAPEPDLAP